MNTFFQYLAGALIGIGSLAAAYALLFVILVFCNRDAAIRQANWIGKILLFFANGLQGRRVGAKRL